MTGSPERCHRPDGPTERMLQVTHRYRVFAIYQTEDVIAFAPLRMLKRFAELRLLPGACGGILSLREMSWQTSLCANYLVKDYKQAMLWNLQ
jgi:hypothetical protein